MSTKRRVAAAASPEVKTRGKRRKVSVSRRAMAPRFLAYTYSTLGTTRATVFLHLAQAHRALRSSRQGPILLPVC